MIAHQFFHTIKMGNTASTEEDNDVPDGRVTGGDLTNPKFNKNLIRDFANSSGMTEEQVQC